MKRNVPQDRARWIETLERRVLLDGTPTPLGTVVGRHLFYNNSVFDRYDPQPTAADNSAIAPDKTALFASTKASFANYSSYDKGINGIIIDFSVLNHAPSSADFGFRIGNDSNPFSPTWMDAPAPSAITEIPTPFDNLIRRVAITWPDHAIQDTWLQITIGHPGGPASYDQFYFGNAIGESGNDPSNAIVDSADEAAARNDPHCFLNPASSDNPHDYNRDGMVNAVDQLIARNNQTTAATALQLITPPPNPILSPLGATVQDPFAGKWLARHKRHLLAN